MTFYNSQFVPAMGTKETVERSELRENFEERQISHQGPRNYHGRSEKTSGRVERGEKRVKVSED